MPKQKKRSPLTSRSYRNPGQYLARSIEKFTEKLENYVSLILIFLTITAWEIVRWWFNLPPKPIQTIILTLVVIIVCFPKMKKIYQDRNNFALGEQGEIYVANYLQNELSEDYQVINDIPEDGYNIDHVVVGPGGIFLIETKTHRKVIGENQTISYENNKVYSGSNVLFRNPLKQAKSSAKNLSDLVKERTNEFYFVNPIVIFPGWFVDQNSGTDLCICNEKYFVGHIQKRKMELEEEQVNKIFKTLTEYVEEMNS